jgi:hypothetical protein
MVKPLRSTAVRHASVSAQKALATGKTAKKATLSNLDI